jgi:hypothetical protein
MLHALKPRPASAYGYATRREKNRHRETTESKQTAKHLPG